MDGTVNVTSWLLPLRHAGMTPWLTVPTACRGNQLVLLPHGSSSPDIEAPCPSSCYMVERV